MAGGGVHGAGGLSTREGACHGLQKGRDGCREEHDHGGHAEQEAEGFDAQTVSGHPGEEGAGDDRTDDDEQQQRQPVDAGVDDVRVRPR